MPESMCANMPMLRILLMSELGGASEPLGGSDRTNETWKQRTASRGEGAAAAARAGGRRGRAREPTAESSMGTIVLGLEDRGSWPARLRSSRGREEAEDEVGARVGVVGRTSCWAEEARASSGGRRQKPELDQDDCRARLGKGPCRIRRTAVVWSRQIMIVSGGG